MSDSLATPSVGPESPFGVTCTSVAALILLSAACSGAGPLSPTEAREPIASPSVSTTPTNASGAAACVGDSKLIGRIELSTADTPGTWWRLTRDGLDAAGITDYRVALEGFFGREFSDVGEAVSFLVAQVVPFDANGNGYVCAYSIRGTRTSIGDPNIEFYLFQVRDDKHAED